MAWVLKEVSISADQLICFIGSQQPALNLNGLWSKCWDWLSSATPALSPGCFLAKVLRVPFVISDAVERVSPSIKLFVESKA